MKNIFYTNTFNMGINDGICMLPAGFSNCECPVGGEVYMLLLSVPLITSIAELA